MINLPDPPLIQENSSKDTDFLRKGLEFCQS